MIGGIISALAIWAIMKIGQRFQGRDLISITREVLASSKYKRLGRILSFPFILVYIVFLFLSAAVIFTIVANFYFSACMAARKCFMTYLVIVPTYHRTVFSFTSCCCQMKRQHLRMDHSYLHVRYC
ncbi:hypothetical protein [Brevibacillus porteri]|uniref:hypothetical protein n=1 Tax=Brevibacillus porteri TaxID=2126350 RepID=UPI003D239786